MPLRRVRSGIAFAEEDDLQVKSLHVETGSERYPNPHEERPPRIMSWRNNLTALSQRRNILFVAAAHEIHVWEPSGPFQHLGSVPEMTITPVMKVNAPGYISPSSPHAINHLIVDELGRDEILLLATDSGNVCAYNVERIFSILERAKADGQRKSIKEPLNPFFSEWVGASAWGLAVHKLARLIAVSANTGHITVFAFALVDPNPGDHDSDTQSNIEFDEQSFSYTEQRCWQDIASVEQWHRFKSLMPDRHRSINAKITYRSHLTNIPSVGFVNSDLDPDGTWMVSTDIKNMFFLWAVWEDNLRPHLSHDMNNMPPFHHEERGWNVLALDPRSFRLCDSLEQSCGMTPRLLMHSRAEEVYDASPIAPAHSLRRSFPSRMPPRPASAEPIIPDIFDDSDGPINNVRMGDEHSTQLSDPIRGIQQRRPLQRSNGYQLIYISDLHRFLRSNGGIGRWNNVDQLFNQVLEDSYEDDGQGGNPTDIWHLVMNDGVYTIGTMRDLVDLITQPPQQVGEEEEEEADEGDETDQDEDIEEIESHIFGGTTILEANPDLLDSSTDDVSVLKGPISFFPILHFSETTIRLFQNPLTTKQLIFCESPLRQSVTFPIMASELFERFNMVKYVPEYGLVLAATQKGRVGLITLTDGYGGGFMAFRLNWIVPLESQERDGLRPLAPLTGMAVSPAQGFELQTDDPFTPNIEQPKDATDSDHVTFFQERTLPLPAKLYRNEKSNSDSHSDINSDRNSDDDEPVGKKPQPTTISQSHALALRNHRPGEPWHGWHPSRRYRVLLMYEDHTVMSYEFWYEWSGATFSYVPKVKEIDPLTDTSGGHSYTPGFGRAQIYQRPDSEQILFL